MRNQAEIIREHGLTINNLIKRLERKSRSEIELANLDRLRKRINLLRSISDSSLIVEMTPTIKRYSDDILERNEEFFMNVNARAEFVKIESREPTSQEEFIFDLIKSVRTNYKISKQEEKDQIYDEVITVFNCCIEYEISASS